MAKGEDNPERGSLADRKGTDGRDSFMGPCRSSQSRGSRQGLDRDVRAYCTYIHSAITTLLDSYGLGRSNIGGDPGLVTPSTRVRTTGERALSSGPSIAVLLVAGSLAQLDN